MHWLTPSPKQLCFSTVCEDGEIRLIKMVGMNEMLVEICYNSTWGLVCDDQWGANDNNAQVVCKQLCFISGGESVYDIVVCPLNLLRER